MASLILKGRINSKGSQLEEQPSQFFVKNWRKTGTWNMQYLKYIVSNAVVPQVMSHI